MSENRISLAALVEHGVAAGSQVRVLLAGEPLLVTEGLRWLPARRLVARGLWRERSVVVKAFAPGRAGAAAWASERQALQALAQRSVPAPECLWAESKSAGSLLVLAEISGQLAAERIIAPAASAERREALKSLLSWVTEQARRGVVQEDAHLSNFLWGESGWFMLDAAGCRIGTISARQLAENLALVLAQVPPADAEAVLTDAEAMNLPSRQLVRKAQLRRYEAMLKKTERDCTQYRRVAVAGLRGMSTRSAYPELLALLDEGAGDLMGHGRMLKDGGASTVVALDSLGWVVKRYNLKKKRNRWKMRLGWSRARRSWRAAHFLQYCGVYTPPPVAYLEDRQAGLAWFISAIHQGPLLDSVNESSQLQREWCASLSEIFMLMRMFRWAHGDMKASNIVLCDAGVGLIDLDSWRRFRSQRQASRAIERDKVRLLRNWVEGQAVRETVAECLG